MATEHKTTEKRKQSSNYHTKCTLDAIMITQCSDKDTMLLEKKMGQETFYAASAYMEYNEAIENSLRKIEKILQFTKGVKNYYCNRQQFKFNKMARCDNKRPGGIYCKQPATDNKRRMWKHNIS